MEFHYSRQHAPAPALNPAPQQAAQQQPVGAPAQHPVAVGAEANPPAGSAGGPRWQTAAMWVAGVVAATTIGYFVNKGLRANDDRRARNKAEKEDNPTAPAAAAASAAGTEPRFVLPNDGTGAAITEIETNSGRLAARLEDVEHWITTQDKRGALRDKS